NKIWNAFRLVKGWEVADIPQPESAVVAIKWFKAQLAKTITEVDDLFSKYRISEALMAVYKLFWDEFSAWYLEMVKPAYQQPIDKVTYEATLQFFEELLLVLHPFMPFITEELWQSLYTRQDGESIVVQLQSKASEYDEELIVRFEKIKEIIAGIRTIRVQKNIPNKETLPLQIVGEHNSFFDLILLKLGNLRSIEHVNEKTDTSVAFLVGTTEYAIVLGNLINIEDEIKKIETEIRYLEGFLQSVVNKLSNERFVANAKPEVVDAERKKQLDAESKISTLREALQKFQA
ncbi:MAG TPA: class I tRNA ligase family protein, partial [Paludibacteraceae bacterium]|nr:class I tRNA ligase family protein [Paludibacteraceae bacterium]